MYSLVYDLYHNFTYAFISLFSIVNPIGASAIFLTMTFNYPTRIRRIMALKVALYGCVLLTCVLFLGSSVLNFFGISLASLQVAGGLLIFASAWQMLNAPATSNEQKGVTDASLERADITFFPLTMPLTAGAGSMAVTVALAARISEDAHETYYLGYLGVLLGIIAVFAVVGLCFTFADRLFIKLGQNGTNIITRLIAFILLAIGVNVIWGGASSMILALK